LSATLTGATPENWTNSQRLARGLPPLSPKFGRTLPGYARTPTKAGEKKPSPSPCPPKKYEGRIKVVGEKGKSLGYLGNWDYRSPNGINCDGPSTELHVSFTTTCCKDKKLIDILVTNPNFKKPYYIGSTTNDILAPGSSTSVGFGNVEQTPALSPPVPFGKYYYESAIWTFNCDTKQITPHYINPDGCDVDTIIAYDDKNNSIFFVGDIAAYSKKVCPVEAVTFYLEDCD